MQVVRGISACACPVVCYILHVIFLRAALSMPRAISLQLSVLDPGEGLPLFLVQTEVQTTEKKFLGDRFLPTPAPPALSQGLDLALVVQENAPNLSYVHACALYATVSCLNNMINLSPVKPSLGWNLSMLLAQLRQRIEWSRAGRSCYRSVASCYGKASTTSER